MADYVSVLWSQFNGDGCDVEFTSFVFVTCEHIATLTFENLAVTLRSTRFNI